jgi:HEPN/RES N-terminal domain 1/RES domain
VAKTMMDLEPSDIQQRYPNKFVCADCFADDHLKTFIEDTAASHKCNYCGQESPRGRIAVPVDDVIERIFEAIRRRYGEAWASGCSWDNEDERYINETWSTSDILDHVELSNDDSTDLYQDIYDAFPQWDWSSDDPWGSTEAEILQWGWNRFVEAVKYRRRFFFTRRDEPEEETDRENLDRGALLERFGRGCAASGLIGTIPTGTTILRCRPRARKTERFSKARELGPPPPRVARQNRMSPAGIPMFYGSDDILTTLAEMPELPKYYAIGKFETLRPLRVLDLTKVKYPSIFDMSEESEYDWLLFMSGFLRDFSASVERDESIHIDYIPTQVVTEYLRDADLDGNGPVVGIKYRSARRKGGICYVLFIDEYGVKPNAGDSTPDLENLRKPKEGYALRLRKITHHIQK